MKRCSKCQEAQPTSAFHRAGNTRDGLHTQCKRCRCAHRRDVHRSARGRDTLLRVLRRALIDELYRRGLYWCCFCHTAKLPREMETCKKGRPVRCRACGAANSRRHYHTRIKGDPERMARLYMQNQKSQIQRARRYREAFVESVDRLVVWERDGGDCGICGGPANPASWHLDHVIPLARGGEHSYANVQVAHPACNRRKSSKLQEELGETACTL